MGNTVSRVNDSNYLTEVIDYVSGEAVFEILVPVLFQDDREESAKSGDLLVETEPIRYELSAVKLNWPKKRDIKRVSRVLSEVTIVNRGAEAANLAEACVYTYKYAVYWGRRHAILNGLSTTITLMNGTSLPNITWGTRDEENRTEVYK